MLGPRLCDQVRVDSVYDANGTYDGTADANGMVDMLGYEGCMVLIFGAATVASATNFLKNFKIVSNSNSTGGGVDHDIAEAVTTDGGTTMTLAAADYGTAVNTALHNKLVALDVKADQLVDGDRYIAAMTTSSGTYPITIVYVRYGAHHSFKDMIQAARTAFQYNGNL